MDEISLNELVEQVKQKDEKAFQELYQRFYKKAYYAALKISGNSADAKDIAQETFIQVHKSIASLNDNDLFIQWLNRIIASKASDLFRKNKTTSLPDDHALFQLQEEENITFIPEASMHFTNDRDLLAYFIKTLDERYRTVIVLRYFSQMSVAEIAAALHVPDGTVKTRLKRAREILKNVIAHYQSEEEITLDFRSADMAVLMSGFFMGEFAAMHIEMPALLPLSFFHRLRHISHQSMIVLSVCAVTALSGGIYAYQILQEHREVTNALDQRQPFGPIAYHGNTYADPESAYYALTLFAHCEVEMKEKTAQEMASIRPLYEELKRYQGVYWKLLNIREWNETFETYVYE